jgi:hypothetical protein
MRGARDLSKLPGYSAALEVLRASLSPRYMALDELERYVDGKQYDDWPHKWLGPDDVPLLERAPHVVEPVVGSALESYEDLLVGEGRFPTITTRPEEDDEDEDNEGIGLSEDESEGLDRLIKQIEKQVELPSAACKAYHRAAGARTAVTHLGVKRGKLAIENFKAKRCWPEWANDDPDKLVALEVKYPYIIEGEGVGESRAYSGRAKVVWYRRRIDEQFDIVYKPSRANQDGSEPTTWIEQSKIQHGYGFCPVIWWPHAKDDDCDSDDGRAIHELLLDEIDSLCRACSQHNRAALYCGDPQIIERGVDVGHNPAPGGVTARSPQPHVSDGPDAKEAWRSWNQPGSGRQARRKGAGVVWQYPMVGDGPLPDVDLLTLEGTALDAVAKDRDSLRNMIAVAMAWVQLDENSLRNPRGGQSQLSNLSGRALEMLYRRQLSRCNKERVDLGSRWIKPVVSMLIRIVAHHVLAAVDGVSSLFLRGTKVLTPELVAKLSRPVRDVATNTVADEWTGPELTLQWPPYFEPNENDAAVISKQAREDYKAGFITLETAVERVAPFYSIEDIEAYTEKLIKEADEKAAKEEKAEAAKGSHLAAAVAGLNAGTPPAGNPKPGAKPPAPPGKPGLAAKRGTPPPGAAASR